MVSSVDPRNLRGTLQEKENSLLVGRTILDGGLVVVLHIPEESFLNGHDLLQDLLTYIIIVSTSTLLLSYLECLLLLLVLTD